jgi:hypothetical protein
MKSLRKWRGWGSSTFFICIGLHLKNKARKLKHYITWELTQATLHFNKYALHLLMHKQRLALVKESTAVRFHPIYSHFNSSAEEARTKRWLLNANKLARGKYLELFAEAECTDVISREMCGSLTAF